MGGLTPDIYRVTVGDERCEDVTVTDNSISCLPPRKEPKELLENHPRVTVCILYDLFTLLDTDLGMASSNLYYVEMSVLKMATL